MQRTKANSDASTEPSRRFRLHTTSRFSGHVTRHHIFNRCPRSFGCCPFIDQPCDRLTRIQSFHNKTPVAYLGLAATRTALNWWPSSLQFHKCAMLWCLPGSKADNEPSANQHTNPTDCCFNWICHCCKKPQIPMQINWRTAASNANYSWAEPPSFRTRGRELSQGKSQVDAYEHHLTWKSQAWFCKARNAFY